jgi:CRP-like cAMP-binding protein
LLDQLPRKDRDRVLGRCEAVELSFGEVLAEPGGPIRNVYFPTESFISGLVAMGASGILEVSLAGNEGFHGVPLALGINVSPGRAVVQGSGPAWQMGAAAFRRELAQCPALRDCIHRYIYVLMAQFLRTAGCNHFHVVEQRVARWLLMTADRTHSPTFRITHEFLAHMLAVRRVGITKAAGALQDHGLIGYVRGAVTIRDRKGLERASCSCYGYDLTVYDSVFR